MSSTSASVAQGEHHHAHHFSSAAAEFSASKLGIWLFLATEIMMFGGLIVAYLIFQSVYPEMFKEGATHLDWRMGALNTVVLLLSSFTMALGIYYAQTNRRTACVTSLALTLLLAGVFLVVKYFEYTGKFHHGIFPGKYFNYHDAEASNLALYFSLYFLMTGLHGSHVIIGMGLIVWVMIRAAQGDFSSKYYTPIEGVGLFWHLVDLIWIYLFPLLYLIG